ncbi:MAG: hypothetical protein ACOVNU_04130 [Candidatus Kapaibacteriota bacterium]
MNQDQLETEIKVVYDVSMISMTSNQIQWQPTPILRWKRISIDKLSYNKVLQQMWHGSLGKQEWRDVQEED